MTELTHQQARDRVERAQAGFLSSADRIALDRHLAACPACREYRSALRADDAALRLALDKAIPRPAPPDLKRVIARVEASAQRARLTRLAGQAVRSLSWATAALGIVVSINWLFANFSRPVEQASPVPGPMAVAATKIPVIDTTDSPPMASPAPAYRPPSSELRMTLSGSGAPINAVSLSPDGSSLAAADSDGIVRIWRVRDGALLTTLEAHDKEATTLAFAPDGNMIATGGMDGTVNFWFARSGAFLRSLQLGEVNPLAIQFSPNGELLAVSLSNYSVALLRVSDGKRLETYQSTIRLDVNQPSDRNSSLIASAESAIWLDGDSNLPFSLNIQGQNGKSLNVVLSPSGNLLASGSTDGQVYIWRIFDIIVNGQDPLTHQPVTSRTITGNLLLILSGHTGWVNSLDFSADNLILASGGDDGAILLWSVLDGRKAGALYGHDGPVTAVDISPDDRLIVSGSSDGTVRIWTLDTDG